MFRGSKGSPKGGFEGSRGSLLSVLKVAGVWTVLDGFGRFWGVLGGFGRFWTVLGGFGRFWAVWGGFGFFFPLP